MRPLICAALSFALAAGAAAAQAAPQSQAPARKPAAVSAERYAIPATYVERGHGYSERARHISTCLATYSASYDWKTDRVAVRPGVTRRCNL